MTRLERFGISLVLADGWYGEIFRELDGLDDSGPVVHAATTPLILGDRDQYAGETRDALRASDAVVVIVNLPSLPQVIAAGGDRLEPDATWSLDGAAWISFHGVPDWQTSLRRTIHVGERVFDLLVFFGSHPPTARLVAAVERVLGTVRIDPEVPPLDRTLAQYFSAVAAVDHLAVARRALWERDAALLGVEEHADHRLAFGADA